MRKDQPVVWWTAAGVLSVIAIGLIGWVGSGVSAAFGVRADIQAQGKTLTEHEERIRSLEAMKTDIAVLKSQGDSMDKKLDALLKQ